MKIKKILSGLTEGIFPKKCISCLSIIDSHPEDEPEGSLFCPVCRITLNRIESPSCRICGLPLNSPEGEDFTCIRCRKNPPYFDSAISSYLYGAAIKDVVERFKFRNSPHLALLLSRLMLSDDHAGRIPDVSMVIPVPLHFKKLLRRGYNQSSLLSKYVSGFLKIPVMFNVLKRVKNTQSQSELSFREREANVRNSFSVKKGVNLDGLNILLVDDVLTTGSTASSCAKELKKHGAKEVHVLTLARTGI
jgi:ComF family protein